MSSSPQKALGVIRCGAGWRVLPEGPRRPLFVSQAAAIAEARRLAAVARACGVEAVVLVQEEFGALGELPADSAPAPVVRPPRQTTVQPRRQPRAGASHARHAREDHHAPG